MQQKKSGVKTDIEIENGIKNLHPPLCRSLALQLGRPCPLDPEEQVDPHPRKIVPKG